MTARVLLLPLVLLAPFAAAPSAHATTMSSIDTAGSDVRAAHARRTTVTATSIALASGRLQVSIASSASRVRLTYRTATRRARSRLVRISSGKGAAVLPRGSRELRVRALGSSRRRGSASVHVRPNPLMRDADDNGIPEHQYDLDTDGRYELALFDADRNGRFEAIYMETDALSGLFLDQNGDSYFELLALDADRNGSTERVLLDADRDGYAELQCLDYVGSDGIADTWVDTRTTVTSSPADRAANDLMVKHIVTLNQLRQLNPASTGYIPYDPAPALLRDAG